jgi:hypothetical protein
MVTPEASAFEASRLEKQSRRIIWFYEENVSVTEAARCLRFQSPGGVQNFWVVQRFTAAIIGLFSTAAFSP